MSSAHDVLHFWSLISLQSASALPNPNPATIFDVVNPETCSAQCGGSPFGIDGAGECNCYASVDASSALDDSGTCNNGCPGDPITGDSCGRTESLASTFVTVYTNVVGESSGTIIYNGCFQ